MHKKIHLNLLNNPFKEWHKQISHGENALEKYNFRNKNIACST